MSVGPSVLAPITSAATTAATNGAAAFGSRFFNLLPRRLVERLAPKPGTGPSDEVRERGWYRVETYTTTSTGARYVATIAQSGDPGYKATAVMLGECGLALALDRDRLPELYGVLTPAAAMGDALLARFPAAGIALGSARLN
jgi:short subunit dehydrogenase-like uncharacterized protein